MAAGLLLLAGVMLKIIKTSDAGQTVLSLSGRIDSEHLAQLNNEIAATANRVVLDLEEVNLVDRDAVGFLVRSQELGIELRNCPPYIREWIFREKGRQPS